MIKQFLLGYLVVSLLMFSVVISMPDNVFSTQPDGKTQIIFNNGNIDAVYNSPSKPTVLSITAPHVITSIQNYHWNHGRGATPGTISLKSHTGQVYGPWNAKGSSGQGGAPNVYWTVYPNITIPAGTYTIVDSDLATWSQNSGSHGAGFTRIEGYKVSSGHTSNGGMATPNCVWESFTNDQRQFATQPGGVLPMRKNYQPGNYLVHVGPAGKHGLDVPPKTWKTFGPYQLVAGSKYAAILYMPKIGIIWEKDSARLMSYSTPRGHAVVYLRNEILDQFYAVCLEPVQTGAGIPFLAGKWAAYRGGKKVADCSILHNGSNLTFIIHRSPEQRSPGRFINDYQVIAEAPDWGNKGNVSRDGSRIDWDNNSYWIKVD